MNTPMAPPRPPQPPSPTPPRPGAGLVLPGGLVRRRDDRVVAGVCAGVGRWLDVDPALVRIAAVLLSFANGVGALAYLVLWAVLPEAPDAAALPPAGAGAGSDVDGQAAVAVDEAGAGARSQGVQRALAVGLITMGSLLLVRWVSPFFPDQLVWPASVGAAGLGLVWSRAGQDDRERWRDALGRLPGDPFAVLAGKGLWVRLHLGGLFLIAGLGWFFAANPTFDGVGRVGLGMLATAIGIAVLLGPWIVGLVRQLRDERGERIRSDERADMAAHLHDSVLQTLALIQRHADSPQQSRSLARRQERELRAWLFDARNPDGAPASLTAALDRLSDDIEADHDVTVDVVAVGDLPLDEHLEALVAALREAAVNAAKHSGEPEVSVYVEVDAGDGFPEAGLARPGPERPGASAPRAGSTAPRAGSDASARTYVVEAYVRDRGKGFDPKAVYGDRRGIAESIIGRMARHGGTAKVRSAPGEGTEVTLRMRRERS